MQKSRIKSERKRQNKQLSAIESLIQPYGGLSAEMKGRKEITVRGCRKIELYKPTLITISVPGGYLNVSGKELTCFAYSGKDIGISGCLRCIFFSDSVPKGGVKK